VCFTRVTEQIPAILPLGTARTSAVDAASHPRAFSHSLGPKKPRQLAARKAAYCGEAAAPVCGHFLKPARFSDLLWVP
jgi:hypothetical protein